MRYQLLPCAQCPVCGAKEQTLICKVICNTYIGISSFLVSNAQFPAQMETLVPCTQLYVSIDASNAQVIFFLAKKKPYPFC